MVSSNYVYLIIIMFAISLDSTYCFLETSQEGEIITTLYFFNENVKKCL